MPDKDEPKTEDRKPPPAKDAAEDDAKVDPGDALKVVDKQSGP